MSLLWMKNMWIKNCNPFNRLEGRFDMLQQVAGPQVTTSASHGRQQTGVNGGRQGLLAREDCELGGSRKIYRDRRNREEIKKFMGNEEFRSMDS